MICAITWAPVIRSMPMRARALERLDTRMGSSFEACLEDVSKQIPEHVRTIKVLTVQLEISSSIQHLSKRRAREAMLQTPLFDLLLPSPRARLCLQDTCPRAHPGVHPALHTRHSLPPPLPRAVIS